MSTNPAALSSVFYASSSSSSISISSSTSIESLIRSSSASSLDPLPDDHVYATIPELVNEENLKNNSIESPSVDPRTLFSSPWSNWLNKHKDKSLEDLNLE